MKNIFFAPHSDDEALFGSFIIQRLKPLIVVCTDGTSHERKFGVPIQQRRNESIAAASIMGVEIEFLGIPEEELTFERLQSEVHIEKGYLGGIWLTPREEGGNPHHDIVSKLGNIFYSTYSKRDLATTGEMQVNPTKEEREIKHRALDCYKSQLAINPQHFAAIRDFPEQLSFTP